MTLQPFLLRAPTAALRPRPASQNSRSTSTWGLRHPATSRTNDQGEVMPITKTDIISGSVCVVALNSDEAQAALVDFLDGDGSTVANLSSTPEDAQAYLTAHPQAGARVYSATLDIRPLNA